MKRRLLQSAIILTALAVFLVMSLCSCVSRPKPAMVRTTTSTPAGRFGLGSTSITETPYESPAYREAGVAMFSRR